MISAGLRKIEIEHGEIDDGPQLPIIHDALKLFELPDRKRALISQGASLITGHELRDHLGMTHVVAVSIGTGNCTSLRPST